MASDEVLDKVVQISSILKGSSIRDVLTILSTQFVYTLLQIYAHDSDSAEKAMRNYFEYIDETYHDMVEHGEILED
jgi:DNA-binding FadR family transcriptional regulator